MTKPRTIWKFDLNLVGTNVSMPKGAEVLCVQMQGPFLKLWAVVDPEEDKEKRYFYVMGTGHTFNSDEPGCHIGTVQAGSFVWHVFESKE